ncbi:hypothetical protein MTP99_014234 [Tenebrio molitor]|nr:hypothetical protein MTP99_014234 [Tenebrio molitor]
MERATTESGFAFCSRNETLPLGTDHIRTVLYKQDQWKQRLKRQVIFGRIAAISLNLKIKSAMASSYESLFLVEQEKRYRQK